MKHAHWRAWLALLMLGLLAACSAPGPGPAPGALPGYGPLSFNRAGADFYIAQGGRFVPAALAADGAIEFRLRSAPFQLGYNGLQANLALAQVPITEISTDPKGFKASRLSGPLAGAREPHSDTLIVYTGTEWSDGNTAFSDETSLKAQPLPGFQLAYQVNRLSFIGDASATLERARGVLHGYIVVYKQAQRMNRDIMPVRLVFEGAGAR